MYKCNCCETEILEEDLFYHDQKGEPLCETCENESWNDSVTVMKYEPGEEPVKILYNTVLEQHMDLERGDYEDGAPDPLESANWKSTDAHRGFVDAKINTDHILIADGWMTGDYDEVAYKRPFHRFVEDLSSGEIYCSFPIYIVLAQTSNVFSTAVSLAIPRGKKTEFRRSLKAAGYTIEDLEQALS